MQYPTGPLLLLLDLLVLLLLLQDSIYIYIYMFCLEGIYTIHLGGTIDQVESLRCCSLSPLRTETEARKQAKK
jgi:hypothetical protein